MYSVEDLLISHGYKLPKSGPPSATPYDKRPADCQRELVDNRAGRGTLNGYEADRGTSITGIYGSRQALVKGYPATDNESGERNQRRKEAGIGIGILGDTQPLGDSLATDSGEVACVSVSAHPCTPGIVSTTAFHQAGQMFYDVPSLTYSEPLSYDERDVSYWRRRGQDFSILLDYADGRELRASAGAWRPQALIAAEEHRAERQAQQLWEDISWLRDLDAAPGQLRVTGERKCQSLGTEEWRPAVGLGRQLSDGDGDRPPKINHYKEMKLSGTWPANQYRDQETQTSPEARKPAPENKEAQQDPATPGTEVPPDSSGVVGTAFTFPIKGVKSLKLSSNSAFSLTSTFSNQLNKSTAQPPAVPPSGNAEETKPAANSGQDSYEQFLLKPSSQRPWDAVKELESIKKEVQDQQQQSSKQPSVDKCIEDLNEAYKDILELGTASNKVPNGSVQIPERIKIRLTSEPLNKPSSLRRSAVSWSVDPEYREVKSAFSRPATKSVTFSKQLREELPVPPRETGFREYRVVAHLSRRRSNDGRTVKLDLPDEPIETPLCDFSPTTNTAAAEVPWADRQPMQDASTLTSPPDYEDICQTLRQTRDPADANKSGSFKPNDGENLQDPNVDSEEECPICKRELENQMRQGPLPPLHEENSSDSSGNQNGSPPQRAALESPEETKKEESKDSNSNQSGSGLCAETREQHSSTEDNVGGGEKTDNAQAENLDNLCTVNPAESIPGDGATAESAPAVLTTDVPVDPKDTEEHSGSETATKEVVELEKKEAISGETPDGSADKQRAEVKSECEGQDSTTPDDKQEQEKKPFAVAEHRLSLRTHLGRDQPDFPEFPPDRLPLSVPPNLDRRLSLSLEGERRSRGPAQRMEALQNKLAISPGRVAVERLARMREVDVMYRMRRLSIRSTDSGEGEAETEGEGKDEQAEVPLPAPPRDEENDQEVTRSQQVSEQTVLKDEEESSLSEPHDPSRVETHRGSVLIDIHIRAEQADFCAACQAQLMQGSGQERRSGSKE
ncbi:Junctional protein associated with coronary artery disease [Collichthys lucidus]|uniref:Junctional protein associated with coronary artery disease n=1 Tax=Collichthys lucidus TaxID=240159 RepID=A0A4U5UVZ7_COLLU|nr:Junctional protein associated with coronary artery disease [Collichthys lucidus]